jgi:NAD(P)-dependent dehydrogenase (short-subunit alcohol dehydrogenase family)
MARPLEGKAAIITGGSSGLGASGVRAFVDAGAKVLVADIREPRSDVAEWFGPEVKFARCDVTREDDVRALLVTARTEFGGLDILYNNAGGGSAPGSLLDQTVTEWDMNMDVMLKSVMLMTKHALPLLIDRGGGSVINTASIAGVRTGIAGLAYSVAKAGVSHFSRMMVPELGRHKIRINTICPGIIPTPALGGAFGLDYEATLKVIPKVSEIYSKAIPLKTIGRPEHVAQAALFFASDASEFLTGQEVCVDGGLSLLGPGGLDMAIPGNVVERIVAMIGEFKAGLSQ